MQTVDDWIRGYLYTYLPDNEAAEAFIENHIRENGGGGTRPLTEARRERLKEAHLGPEPASLVEISRQEMERSGLPYSEEGVRAACREWLENDAPPLFRQAVDIDTKLPPTYVDTIRDLVRPVVKERPSGTA